MSTIAAASCTSTSMDDARKRVPVLPGATNSWSTCALSTSFQARACATLSSPRTKTFMCRSYQTRTAGANDHGMCYRSYISSPYLVPRYHRAMVKERNIHVQYKQDLL